MGSDGRQSCLLIILALSLLWARTNRCLLLAGRLQSASSLSYSPSKVILQVWVECPVPWPTVTLNCVCTHSSGLPRRVALKPRMSILVVNCFVQFYLEDGCVFAHLAFGFCWLFCSCLVSDRVLNSCVFSVSHLGKMEFFYPLTILLTEFCVDAIQSAFNFDGW
jgi:hypothetical protein